MTRMKKWSRKCPRFRNRKISRSRIVFSLGPAGLAKAPPCLFPPCPSCWTRSSDSANRTEFAVPLSWLAAGTARPSFPVMSAPRSEARLLRALLLAAALLAPFTVTGLAQPAQTQPAEPQTPAPQRSAEHTSELQSPIRHHLAVFCL